MKTISEIKGRCRVDEGGCWIWSGALSGGRWPRLYGPDYSKPGAPMVVQTGRRVVWQILKKKAVPNGWRAYSTCNETLCLNPAHMKCGPTAEWGAHVTASGVHRGNIKRVISGRQTGRARCSVSPEMAHEILASPETGEQLAARLNLSRQAVSRVRRGTMRSLQPVGGMFSGLLMAANSGQGRARA